MEGGHQNLDPLSQSVAGSTTNQMEGVEGDEQSAPIHQDREEQPHENVTEEGGEEELVFVKRFRVVEGTQVEVSCFVEDGYGCACDPDFYRCI